jgi:hypothetical protein
MGSAADAAPERVEERATGAAAWQRGAVGWGAPVGEQPQDVSATGARGHARQAVAVAVADHGETPASRSERSRSWSPVAAAYEASSARRRASAGENRDIGGSVAGDPFFAGPDPRRKYRLSMGG